MGQVGNRLSDLFETMENELYKKCFKDDIDKEIVSLADINDFFFKQNPPILDKCCCGVVSLL